MNGTFIVLKIGLDVWGVNFPAEQVICSSTIVVSSVVSSIFMAFWLYLINALRAWAHESPGNPTITAW